MLIYAAEGILAFNIFNHIILCEMSKNLQH